MLCSDRARLVNSLHSFRSVNFVLLRADRFLGDCLSVEGSYLVYYMSEVLARKLSMYTFRSDCVALLKPDRFLGDCRLHIS